MTAARPVAAGTLHLEAPDGWRAQPPAQDFHLARAGARARLKFTLTAPKKTETKCVRALATIQGKSFDNERQLVSYAHIPPQLLQPPAALRVVCLELARKGSEVGYIAGAGDSLADDIEKMGYKVRMLDESKLGGGALNGLDAIIIGVRAFNVNDGIAAAIPQLFDYVEQGGTMIIQYNRPDGLKTPELTPYHLRISHDRVTDERSEVTFLTPDSPVLTTPNRITQDDFQGWVQERGLYFPDEWDSHFTPILECHDPGEQKKRGALLVAHYGKGYVIYTGLSFFRQLPAGVKGAYRLMANLISIGK